MLIKTNVLVNMYSRYSDMTEIKKKSDAHSVILPGDLDKVDSMWSLEKT